MPRDALFASDWLVPAERDEQIGLLRSGKESEVYLVARHGGGRTALLAEKRFRPRESRWFKNESLYNATWGQGRTRESRAMRKKSRFGKRAVHQRWIAHEWETLVHLHSAGVTVPPPVEPLDDGYRMAFIGDGGHPAPRLSDVDLDPVTAARVWDELLAEIGLIVAADCVHGDLSAYNVLWWRDRAVIIDLSQSVDVITHPAARDLLERDIASLARYFTRRGVPADVERALLAVGADAHRFARQQR